jgi:hypothetical protein
VSDDGYFLEIESHFIARRGTPFLLNPKDWELMRSWRAEGIPLPVILEAIDAVFDRFDAKERKVNALSFCKDEVKKLWADRRELQIGAEGVVPEDAPGPRLEALADVLASSPRPTVAAFADRVRTLKGSVPHIEEQLMELETSLIDALLPEAPELRTEAEALVAGSDEKTRARSIEAHVRRLVRDRFEIPRLSLF